MVTFLSALILAAPLIPLIMLASATSEIRRRTWLMGVVCFLCANGLWYATTNWALHKAKEFAATLPISDATAPTLFDGRGAALMTNFFSNPRLALVYVFSISLAAYFANLRAAERIRNETFY